MRNDYETQEISAQKVADAIRAFADHPERIENFESYLSQHFQAWLERFGQTPEDLSDELLSFATME